MFQVYAVAKDYYRSVAVAIIDEEANKRKFFGSGGEPKIEDMPPMDEINPVTCFNLTFEEARQLREKLDFILTRSGMPNKAQSFLEGKIESMREHLDDMKKLVFDNE